MVSVKEKLQRVSELLHAQTDAKITSKILK